MANWTNPVLGSTHTNILTEIKDRDVDCIVMLDGQSPTNLPAKAKYWNDTLKVFQSWIASAWSTLILAIAGGGTGSNTAGGARTNLEVDSSTEVTAKVAAHQAITNPHSSTPNATVNRLILRDAYGRAQVVAPSAAADIATKAIVDSVQANLETHAALANPHGAVSAPTVGKIILRDAYGRAQVVAPSAAADIATKAIVDAVQANLEAHAALPTTQIFSWVIANPAVGGIPGPRLKVSATAVRMDCFITGASGFVDFNIEERTIIGSGGVNLFAADQRAYPGGDSVTSFSNPGLAADNWLWLDISFVSGTPPYFEVTLAVTIP